MRLLRFFPLVLIFTAALAIAAGEKEASGSNSGNTGDREAAQVGNTEWPEPLAQVITVQAEGEILHYQKRSSWEEVDFSEILASTADFETDARDAFERNLERYNVQALDIAFEFHEKKNSVIVECNIRGAMYGTNSYDFHWLLGDLPFDLYQFKQHDKELAYDGAVNEVPTEIRLIFPYGVAHCHEHVWPR